MVNLPFPYPEFKPDMPWQEVVNLTMAVDFNVKNQGSIQHMPFSIIYHFYRTGLQNHGNSTKHGNWYHLLGVE